MEALKKFALQVVAKGYVPLLCIASEHGTFLCFHIYAVCKEFTEGGSEEQYKCFRYSEDQKVLPYEERTFASKDEGNADFRSMRILVSRLRNVVVDMTEFMKEVA